MEEGEYPLIMAVSVPKRIFRRAVDRNLMKRRIREAYRLNKLDFYSSLTSINLKIQVVIQIRTKELADFKTIEHNLRLAMLQLIGRLRKEISE